MQLLAPTKATTNSERQGNLYDPLERQKEKDEAIYEDIDKPEASPLHPPVPAPRRFLGEFMRDLVHYANCFPFHCYGAAGERHSQSIITEEFCVDLEDLQKELFSVNLSSLSGLHKIGEGKQNI